MPLKRYESWYAQNGLLVRPNQLQIEIDEPTAANTGVQPFYQSGLSLVNANTTFTTDDEIIEGYEFRGWVAFRADNVTLRNCWIRGNTTVPSNGTGLIDCTHSLCTNAKIEWCWLWPQAPHWDWDTGIKGHDFTMKNCHIKGCTDGINVFNTNISFPETNPYFTNVVLQQNYVQDVVFWTAQTGNVVHPSGLLTHNDSIQHQGGRGTIIQGNTLNTYYARQSGHWQSVGSPTVPPYTGVGINTLPAGPPRYAGPWVPGGDAVNNWPAVNTLPDFGAGTEATGRYNVGALSGIQIGKNIGWSYDLEILGNWFYGASFAINGGGNYYPGNNEYLGNFLRNRFSRDQGTQSGGGNSTQTINIDTDAEPGWNGHFSAPTTGPDKNYYMDNGAAITVRV